MATIVRYDIDAIHAAIAAMGVPAFLYVLGLKSYQPSGSQYRIACPIHKGDERNCIIGVREGVVKFICNSACGGQGGDALALIAAVRGLDITLQFQEVLAEASRIAGVTPGLPPPRHTVPPVEDPAVVAARLLAAESTERVLSALLELCPLDGEGLRYLTKTRGLSEETCRQFRVGYVGDAVRVARIMLQSFPPDVLARLGVIYHSSDYGVHLAFQRHPLLFPVLKNGQPIYLQGRALGEVTKKSARWRSMRGSPPAPYNVDALADKGKAVLLCEGPVDTMSAAQSVSYVAALGIIGAGGWRREWDGLLKRRNVILAMDHDAAGSKGAGDVGRRLHEGGVRVWQIWLPEGVDINDFMRGRAA